MGTVVSRTLVQPVPALVQKTGLSAEQIEYDLDQGTERKRAIRWA